MTLMFECDRSSDVNCVRAAKARGGIVPSMLCESSLPKKKNNVVDHHWIDGWIAQTAPWSILAASS